MHRATDRRQGRSVGDVPGVIVGWIAKDPQGGKEGYQKEDALATGRKGKGEAKEKDDRRGEVKDLEKQKEEQARI